MELEEFFEVMQLQEKIERLIEPLAWTEDVWVFTEAIKNIAEYYEYQLTNAVYEDCRD